MAIRRARTAPAGCLAVAAVVACPTTGRVLAAEHDSTGRGGDCGGAAMADRALLGHAVMNAIDALARQGNTPS